MPSELEEIELKFGLSGAALDQLRWEVFDAAPARPLRSIYFDTPERALAERRLAVRMRHDGTDWVQTVKGGGAVARYEDEVVRDGPELDRDRLERAPGGVEAEVIAALSPVFQVEVERRGVELTHGEARIELALDEGVVRAGDRTRPVRELELELKSGELSDLFGAARQICVQDGVRLSLTSKAEQGYRLAEDAALEPAHFDAPRLAPDISVGGAFQALALAALAQLCTAANLVDETGGVEAVHQARVALRRLRVLVGAFDDAVGDDRAVVVKAELKRMTALFADARSLDVLADRNSADGGARALAFGEAIEQARLAAHGRARAGVADPRFGAGLIDLAEWILCGPWTVEPDRAAMRDESLASLAGKLLEQRRRRMRKRGRKLDWADDHGRHKLRIQAKKMHYLVDALAPAETSGSFYRRLKRLQAHLGDLNDIATTPDTVKLALGNAAPMAAALAGGVLIGERRAGAPRLIRRAQRAFRKWAKQTPGR